jgi:malic enzyme
MVLAASYGFSDYFAEKHGKTGRIYPTVEELPEAAVQVAARVLQQAHADGVAKLRKPDDPVAHVRRYFWKPHYVPVIRGKAPPTEMAED